MCVIYEWLGQKIAFAAPPKTASTWFQRTCVKVGFVQREYKGANKHKPEWPDNTDWNVTIVRHAKPWLMSYHNTMKGSWFNVEAIDKVQREIDLELPFREVWAMHQKIMPQQPLEMWSAFHPPRNAVVLRTEYIADDTADFLYKAIRKRLIMEPKVNVTKVPHE